MKEKEIFTLKSQKPLVNVGETYKTIGDWDVCVVYIPFNDISFNNRPSGFYAVHKPNTNDESVPIYHYGDGAPSTVFSVNAPPIYNQKKHPAHIIMPEKKDGDENSTK